MKNAWGSRSLSTAALLAASVLIGDSTAQQLVNPVGRVRIASAPLRTAEYQTKSNFPGSAAKKDWLQIDVRYETVVNWTDELTLTYYVWMETSDPREPNVLLKGEGTYILIEKGSHMAAAYVHPSVLRRYGKVKGVAVEITFQGRTAAAQANPDSFNYRNAAAQLAPKDGLVLIHEKSPFAEINNDNYEMLKPEAPR